ncbi:DnaJ domain-containing protein, partial [Blyttiomyces helicus]
LLVLLAVLPSASAWEKEDFEIFDLNDALVQSQGPTANFYTVLGVAPDATPSEINKAYRKNSLSLHPDKNSDPEAHVLYSLLTSIAAILKDPESRGRYDSHLSRGFPTWRGAGYHYARFSPGPKFLFVLFVGGASFVQYASAWI